MNENTDLYELLGVSKTATDVEIKKNYHKLAKAYHPDKNPEAGDKFKEISFAYEVLSNVDKRKIYDQFGMKGLQEGADGFADSSEFFAQWFPFGGHSKKPSKPAPQVIKVPVKLEDMYNGNVVKKVNYECMEYCNDCEGKGGPEESMEKCSHCNGTGTIPSYSFMGLGPVSSLCHDCAGRGNTVPEALRCVTCSGAGMQKKEKNVDVTVEIGVPNMFKIPFPGAGNQQQDSGERSDLVVVLAQEPHDYFVRRQNDLHLRPLDINLTESLCHFEHCIEHLDGRHIVISTEPGDVLKHGEVRIVKGEGMPLRNNPFDRGDLIIEFRIVFPENNFATPEQLALLESVLPPREEVIIPPEAEEVELTEPEPYGQGFSSSHRPHDGDDDDDEYENASGPRLEEVQCKTA